MTSKPPPRPQPTLTPQAHYDAAMKRAARATAAYEQKEREFRAAKLEWDNARADLDVAARVLGVATHTNAAWHAKRTRA